MGLVSDASVWTHLFQFLFFAGFSPIKNQAFWNYPHTKTATAPQLHTTLSCAANTHQPVINKFSILWTPGCLPDIKAGKGCRDISACMSILL